MVLTQLHATIVFAQGLMLVPAVGSKVENVCKQALALLEKNNA
jgi:hypothetical protein